MTVDADSRDGDVSAAETSLSRLSTRYGSRTRASTGVWSLG